MTFDEMWHLASYVPCHCITEQEHFSLPTANQSRMPRCCDLHNAEAHAGHSHRVERVVGRHGDE